MPVSGRGLPAVLVVLALVIGSGCGRGDAAAVSPPASTAPDTSPRTTVVPADVEIVVSGAMAFVHDGAVQLTISRFEPVQPELRLLTVGLGEFTAVADGRRLRTAFDLAGTYDGPGRYSFGAGGQGSAGLSNAFVHVVELRDPDGAVETANIATAQRFDRAMVPCAVEIAEGERAGVLHCPQLADASGAVIDYRMTWQA